MSRFYQASDAMGVEKEQTKAEIHPVVLMLARELEQPSQVTPEQASRARSLLESFYQLEEDEISPSLLLEALEEDPANLECHLELIDLCGLEDDLQLPVLTHLLQLAERKLPLKGGFHHPSAYWEDPFTRAYLRVAHRLAEEYHFQGQYQPAAALWSTLRPLDCQHMLPVGDWLLLTWLLLGDTAQADLLIADDSQGLSACAKGWGKLLSHLIQGRESVLEIQWMEARQANPTMEACLIGIQEVPPSHPMTWEPHTPEEAHALADAMLPAWQAHPEALRWLESRVARE